MNLNSLLGSYNSYTPKNNEEKELEVRLNWFLIDRQLFSDKNLEFLGIPEEWETFDLIDNNYRIRKYVSGKNKNKVEAIVKETVKYWKWDEYNAKVSFSIERKESSQTQFSLVRFKQTRRYIYTSNNVKVFVDVTDVWEEDRNGMVKNETPYKPEQRFRKELEVEFPQQISPELFDSIMSDLFSRLLQSKFSIQERTGVIQTINSILNPSPRQPNTFLLFKPNQPLPLTMKEVENDIFHNPYQVALKYDGERKILFGVRLGSFIYIGILNPFQIKYRIPSVSGFQNFIFDCEMIQKDNRDVYCIFDLILYNNSFLDVPFLKNDSGSVTGRVVSITKCFQELATLSRSKEMYYDDPEKKRLRTFKFFELFYLAKKPYSVSTVYSKSELNKRIEQTYNTPLVLWDGPNKMEDDGLIFTPNGFYNETVYKWKPENKLTIDFYVNKEGILLVQEKEQMVPFQGSKNYPLGIQTVNDARLGMISEFLWDWEKKKFVFQRERQEKLTPNFILTAQSNWDLINNPVSRDNLFGKPFALMRKYHNQIKLATINFIRNQGIKTVLDVGSGRGGDVSKWKKNGMKVYAVEPNEEHIVELKRRIKEANANVKVFHGPAQQIPDMDIPKTRAITFFNSLTFFGDLQEMENLISILKNQFDNEHECYFVFVVMDKNKVMRVLKNGSWKLEDEGRTLVEIKQLNETSIEINLQDTIVGKQKEYLFPTEEFIHQVSQQLGFLPFPEVDEFLNQNKNNLIPSTIAVPDVELEFSKLFRVVIMRRPIIPNLEHLHFDSLKPLKLDTFRFYNELSNLPFSRIGVPADPSAFFHATLGVISEKMRKLDIHDAKDFVELVRREVAVKLDDSRLANYDFYPDEDHIEQISKLFGFSLIIYDGQTMKRIEYLYKNKPILVLLRNNLHFELLGVVDEETNMANVLFFPKQTISFQYQKEKYNVNAYESLIEN